MENGHYYARHNSVGEGEVHVWRARLDPPDEQRVTLAASLSDEERARAERRVFEQHRRRAIVSRGLLRAVLASYLGCPPAALAFAEGANGKPHLVDGALEFNLAHSGDLALVAIARSRPVGIDVEAVERALEIDAIANRFFAPAERASLAALPVASRVAAFFAIWTLKEAYLKARGDGLRAELAAFAVSAGRPPGLKPIGDAADSAGWTLRQLDPGPGFVAALCIGGHADVLVNERDWRAA